MVFKDLLKLLQNNLEAFLFQKGIVYLFSADVPALNF
jgi:hypothetical protein